MKRVITERKYREAVEKISISFKDAGGYKKALMEISKFKILHSIVIIVMGFIIKKKIKMEKNIKR